MKFTAGKGDEGGKDDPGWRKQPTDMCVGRGGVSFLPYHYHQKKINNKRTFIYLFIHLFKH